MMKKISIILAAVLMTACGVQKSLLEGRTEPFSESVVRSEMQRCPEASFLDGQEGNLKWNYTTGLELKAFLDAADATDTPWHDDVVAYVEAWYDAIIDEDGNIYNYQKSNFTLDHICPGLTLFQLYDLTGKAKYRMAMDVLMDQLKDQPRTPEGGFWHKQVYPEQMWLDGLYMAEPFYAEYTLRYVNNQDYRRKLFADIVHQFETVYHYTYDVETGLLRHAWDSSHEMFWCNPATGQSQHAWGRAMGWYMMALVDVMEILPAGEGREALAYLFLDLWYALKEYADPSTGLWYQVLDCPGREGNYLEASCNAMFVYAWLKAVRLGLLEDRSDARCAYRTLIRSFVTEDEGIVNLHQCCEVAGLGGKDNRSGDYEYYIHERVRDNDPKGIGPLIWAALEYEKL